MPKFNVNFSELEIEVNTFYDYTPAFCKDYLSKGEAVFSVSTTQEDIDREIEISEFNPRREYAESICVYREIAERLPLYNRMIMHGAVIEYNNKGYIFTAPSGTGKTTHIRLWQKCLGEDKVHIVNGDKPILKVSEDGAIAYSTPFAGKEGYQNHSKCRVNAICFLKQSEENKIYRLKSSEYLSDMMSQLYRPYNPESLIKTLDLLELLLKDIPVYRLECNISEEAVKTAFEQLTGERYKNED